MAPSILIDGAVRDRLRHYGSAGMTYSEILTRLMDTLDRSVFVEETRRRFERLTEKDLVDLADVG